MIERTFNSDIVAKATAQVEYGPDEEHVKDWLAYEGNVAFTNDAEDVGMFERVLQHEDAVYGHYFFFSRGRKALDVAKEMVKAIFDPQYNVSRIVGKDQRHLNPTRTTDLSANHRRGSQESLDEGRNSHGRLL